MFETSIGFACSCIPRSYFYELITKRCRRFPVQARDPCVSRDLQSRLRYWSVQEFCGPGTPRCAIPQSLQCSAKLSNAFLFLLGFLYFFFSHGFGFFPFHTFRIVSYSNQPSQHNPQYILDFFFFFSPKPDFPHTRKVPRWVLEILVMKYLGCVFEHCH